jgi:hypothetical protein
MQQNAIPLKPVVIGRSVRPCRGYDGDVKPILQYIFLVMIPLLCLGLWLATIHVVETISLGHRTMANGMYAHRFLNITSEAGYIRIESQCITATNQKDSERFQGYDLRAGRPSWSWWAGNGGGRVLGDTFEIFRSGLMQFRYVNSGSAIPGSGLRESMRFLEFPHWIVVLIASVPLALTVWRDRKRRRTLHQRGFPPECE